MQARDTQPNCEEPLVTPTPTPTATVPSIASATPTPTLGAPVDGEVRYYLAIDCNDSRPFYEIVENRPPAQAPYSKPPNLRVMGPWSTRDEAVKAKSSNPTCQETPPTPTPSVAPTSTMVYGMPKAPAPMPMMPPP